MHTRTMDSLREIGAQLDQNQFPRIYNGGIIKPNDTAVVLSKLGKEKDYVRSKQRRPPTRSRQGTSGRQRQADRPRASHRTTPIIRTSFRAQYEAELGEIQETYPGIRYWRQKEGLWLLTESSILPGLGKKATFLTAFPFTPTLPAKGWGFWTTAVSNQWIGPRHTNFPDGSICAFEPRDQTWVNGDEIVKLLDLFSLWALRQLHLEICGRWPGYQSVHHPYERLTELRDDEFCGCGNTNQFYGQCCKKHDLARDKDADAFDFYSSRSNGGVRTPPETIKKIIRDREERPPIITPINYFCM